MCSPGHCVGLLGSAQVGGIQALLFQSPFDHQGVGVGGGGLPFRILRCLLYNRWVMKMLISIPGVGLKSQAGGPGLDLAIRVFFI